jgi:hypothetical protein
MNSIERVIEKHGEEIRKEYEALVPPILKDVFTRVDLENKVYIIGVTWVFKDGSTLEGPSIDIDDLAQQYPDCEVGY